MSVFHLHRRLVPAAGLVFCIVFPLRGAAQAPKPEPPPDAQQEIRERLNQLQDQMGALRERLAQAREETIARFRQWWERKQGEWRALSGKAQRLGHTYKLEFRLEPVPEVNASVTVAASRFALDAGNDLEGKSYHLKVEGNLHPPERTGGPMLLTVEASCEFAQPPEFARNLRVHTGVPIEPGKTLTLAAAGDVRLVVSLELAKPQKP